jgi:hypothetical protein
MIRMIIAPVLIVLGLYLACGIVFAGPFVLFGVQRIDPAATRGSWGFRALLIPGAAAFWPLLLYRWLTGVTAPPEEKNSHRSRSARPPGNLRDP